MIEQLVIRCDGEDDTFLAVDYDKPGKCADLVRLDADLKLIAEGKLDTALPEDTYDYANHQWETPKGKLIGELFARVNAGEEF